MQKIITYLKGKKSYIIAAGGAVVIGLYLAGVLDLTTTNILLGLLGFGGIAALRAGMK